MTRCRGCRTSERQPYPSRLGRLAGTNEINSGPSVATPVARSIPGVVNWRKRRSFALAEASAGGKGECQQGDRKPFGFMLLLIAAQLVRRIVTYFTSGKSEPALTSVKYANLPKSYA